MPPMCRLCQTSPPEEKNWDAAAAAAAAADNGKNSFLQPGTRSIRQQADDAGRLTRSERWEIKELGEPGSIGENN